MVKNTTGGTGTKSLARKQQTKNNNKLVLSTNELEQYGCVTKMFGNGMCEVTLNDSTTRMGHIRGKFKNYQKRHNMLSAMSIVLVGLREWENPSKNCDILTIYYDLQIEQLKSIPRINIDIIIQKRMGITTSTPSLRDFDYVTTDDVVEEAPAKKSDTVFALVEQEQVDIDDI